MSVLRENIASITCSVVALCALMVMIGWFFQSPQIVQIAPGLAPMQFNTSLCFLLLGLACILKRTFSTENYGNYLAVFALLIAATALIEHFLKTDIGIDTLFVEPFTVERTAYPGRMSMTTAWAFILSCFGFLSVSHAKRTEGDILWVIAALASLAISTAALVEYSFGLSHEYGLALLLGMALHTTICHFLVALSIIALSPIGLMGNVDRQRNYFLFSAPLVVCIALSIVLWQGVLSLDSELQESSLKHDAEVRVDIAKSEYYSAINMLTSLRQFYVGSTFVDEDEFESYVKPLMSEYPALMAIDWCPRTEHSERAALESALINTKGQSFKSLDKERKLTKRPEDSVYYPVLYTYPKIQDGIAYGFDHYSDELRTVAMDKAARSGNPTATETFHLFRVPADFVAPTDILITVPVYQRDQDLTDIYTARDKRLLGYLIGVIRSSELLAEAFEEVDDVGLDISLWYEPKGEAPILSYSYPSKHSDRFLDERVNNGGMMYEARFRTAGTNWILRVTPTEYYLKTHTTGSASIVLLLSLFGTYLFSAYLFLMKRSQDEAVRNRNNLALANDALQEREEWLSQLSQGSPIGIFRTNSLGECVYVNKAWKELTGLKAEQAMGTGWSNAIHPEDKEEVFQKWQETADRGLPYQDEFRFVRPDGAIAWTSTLSEPVFNPTGELVGHVGTCFDLTERKSFERELTELSSVKSAIIDNAGYSIISTDTEGTIVTFNCTAEKLLGYKASEVIGNETPALIHDKEEVVKRAKHFSAKLGETVTPGFETFVAETKRGLESIHEWKYIRKDGTTFPVLLSVTAIRDENREITGYLGIAADITERVKLREQLASNEARLRLATEGAGVGTWDYDLAEESIVLSSYWYKMLGYTQDEVVPDLRFLESLCHPDDRAKFSRLLKHGGQAQDDSYEFEYRLRASDGSWMWCLGISKAIRAPQTKVLKRVVGVQLDITKSKEAQEQLLEAKKAAEKATEAKASFVANMSHEIRTPLTAIIGYAEQLLDEEISKDERTEFTQNVVHSGEHLLELVNDILDYSKIEADMLEISNDTEQLFQITSLVEAGFQQKAKDKEISFGVEYDYPLPQQIVTDGLRVKQILINLIGNAIKFTEKGGVKLVIRYDRDANELIFRVIDTGIGLTPEQIPMLFKDFSQADGSTTKRFGGTGLGLSISQKLVKLLGGTITVESESGVGSTFILTIPVGEKAKETLTDSYKKTVVSKKDLLPENVGGRALIVDDVVLNQKLFSRILTNAGLDVTVAENGKIGLEIAQQSDFELILMDMQMPVMDGYEATQELRRRNYALPIIGCTADTTSNGHMRCIKAGCDDILIKPFSSEDLADIILRYIVGHDEHGEIDKGLYKVSEFPELQLEFVKHLPEKIDLLIDAFSADSLTEIERLAHNLRGSCGLYNIYYLMDVSAKIEQAAGKEESQLFATLKEDLIRSKEHLTDIQLELEELVKGENDLQGDQA